MVKQDYLLIGTTTADLTPNGRVLGGTVSYAAPVLTAFGHNVKIVTSANPNDPLVEQLQQIAECHIVSSEYTPTFENRYAADGTRTQYVRHTAQTLHAYHIPENWRDSQYVHIAPLADDVDVSIAQQFADSTLLLTPQGFLRQWDTSGLVSFKHWLDTELLAYIDIIICSVADFHEASNLKHDYANSVPQFVLTNGEHGGILYEQGGGEAHYQAYPAQEIDPTGAGDVFAAGVFGSLPFVGNNMQKAIEIGARLAAYNVSVQGVAEFTVEFIEEILKQVNS